VLQPKIGAWINFVFLLLTGVAAGTVDFYKLPPEITNLIKVLAANAAWAISCANIVFHLYSSSTQGPMVGFFAPTPVADEPFGKGETYEPFGKGEKHEPS